MFSLSKPTLGARASLLALQAGSCRDPFAALVITANAPFAHLNELLAHIETLGSGHLKQGFVIPVVNGVDSSCRNGICRATPVRSPPRFDINQAG
ncbi:hypothetical protein CYMTET_14752 [Cymbomonas tetramitiformis]|uniref:Uncharacterized protein n=1 Tax=Cymbomonas tetramitiformis TaxID=36881 RepID=A0AAE0GFS4_9CHLO|nr:hypothetical protein CYMTET_14752 [Cymbomonas tetramitiformis]